MEDQKETLFVGGAPVKPADLARVARTLAAVKLDRGRRNKIASATGKATPADAASFPAADENKLPAIAARAVTLSFLIAASHETSGASVELVDWLTEVLSAPVALQLGQATAATDLLRAATTAPDELMVMPTSPASMEATPAPVAASSVAGFPAAALATVTKREHELLTLSGAAAVGVAALASAEASALVVAADVAAAFSIEAAGASTALFGTATNEHAANLPGQTAAAQALRTLTQASRSADKQPLGMSACSLERAHETSGPAREGTKAAARTARQQLNRAPAEVSVGKGKKARAHLVAHGDQQLRWTLTSLRSVLVVVRQACTGRLAAVAAAWPGTGSQDAARAAMGAAADAATDAATAPQSPLADALALLCVLAVTRQCLVWELSASMRFVCEQERAWASKQVGKAQKAAERAAAEAAAAAKREAELAAMEPADRAKAEAADAKKAAKRARKAKKEDGSALAVAAPSADLGKGNALIRVFFRDVALLLQGDAAQVPLEGEGADDPACAGLPRAISMDEASIAAAIDPNVAPAFRAGPQAPACAAAGGEEATSVPNDSQLWRPLAVRVREVLDAVGQGGGSGVKVPKGTRDFGPEQMEVRQAAFETIRGVFRRHGAAEIDTPVFELRSTLMGKYGEEGGKLVYDLADQGGELLSMRYDLTVPFARYLATHGTTNMKRYHISRVYRRDNVAIKRGRYREFYQCDFDIAGDYDCMLPDAEVLTVVSEILAALPIGQFQVKLNHRVLLDAMLEMAGVPAAKFRTVCSSIDKLDKEPWADVRREIVEDKGLPPQAADRIGELVQKAGEPMAMLAELRADPSFTGHADAVRALDELELLFGYMQATGALQYLSFDLSLARGLDYYTGVIYEAVLIDGGIPVGSIAAGGRYDNLVGMFSGNTQVPCVGVSIGIERVFAIMEAKAKAAAQFGRRPVQVRIATMGKADMSRERFALCAHLWQAGISAEMTLRTKCQRQKEMMAAESEGVPFLLVLGEDELAAGTVGLRNMASQAQETVPRAELVQRLLAMGATVDLPAAGAAAEATAAAGDE